MEIEFIQKAGEYRLIRYIEKGLQGKVYLAKDPTQKYLCAVKISSLSDLDEFRRQKQFLSSFNHPNIVNFKDSYEKVQVKIQGQPIRKNNIIILELAQKGQIYQFVKIGKFSEQIARYYITQLLQGLKYLHQKNIAHRDIKLQNLLISKDYTLKIADFGFAKKKNSKQTLFTSQLGTQGYQAPQILKNSPNYDGQKTDMFAVGVILFIFVKGFPPFSQANITDKAYKMIADKRFNKFWQAHQKKLGKGFFSQQFKDLINKFFSYQPNQRPTFQSLQKQPWFLKKFSEKPLHLQEIHKQMEQRYKVILSNNENMKSLQQQFDKFYMKKTKMIDEKDQEKGDRGQQNDQRVKQFKLSCKKYKQIFINLSVQNSVIVFLVWLQDYMKKCQQKGQIFIENDLYNIKPFKYCSKVQVLNKFILVNLKFQFQTYFQDQQTKKLSQDDIQKTIESFELRLQISTQSFDFRHLIFTEQQQSQGIKSSEKYVWKNQIKKHIMVAIDCFAVKF